MRQATLDTTAGERARGISAHPGAPQRILDPTDPRCRGFSFEPWDPASGARRIVDPTDPGCGRPARGGFAKQFSR